MCDCCSKREEAPCSLKTHVEHATSHVKLDSAPKPWECFKLLMWKNRLQQMRRRGQTIAELIIPVFAMTLILIIRWQVEPYIMGVAKYPEYKAHLLDFSMPILYRMNFSALSVAYSPRSPILEKVVKDAFAALLNANDAVIKKGMAKQIRLPNLTVENETIILPDNISDITLMWNITLPNKIKLPKNVELSDYLATLIKEEMVKNLFKIKAYNKSADLKGIYSKEEETQNVICAIAFNDSLFGATELPNDLSYSLRFPERPRLNSFYMLGSRTWRTDMLFPIFEFPGPRYAYSYEGGNDPGYTNEMFIAIMHVVSMDLISKRTGKNLSKYIVYMRRYPHPAYVQDFELITMQMVFPMFMMLSFSYTVVNLVRAITVEKECELKEAMKIMGLPIWLHWTAWFCKQFIYLVIVVIFIIIIVKVPWFSTEDGYNDYAVFSTTPWHVLFVFMILYLACTIFFSFMMSGLFSKGNTASLFTGVFWFLSYVPAFLATMEVKMPIIWQILTCLSVNTAMAYGFTVLLAKESAGGMRWGDIFYSPSVRINRLLFGHVIIMLIFDSILYMLITLYLEQVLPGPFGNPQKWYFLFQKSYWRGIPTDDTPMKESDYGGKIVKEKDPTGHTVGVKMMNLTKVYGQHTVVNNLSLNIYNDQITVLLGHNGAGKSTTISMLTGNVRITRGSVLIAGYDITKQTRAARACLGLCPQHNVLFNELTVHEHLEFYSRIKGMKGSEMYAEIDKLIEKLELVAKRDYKSGGLSGGQKRRLQVGIALCGGTTVVLLDEPTSGMDPASRRGLWELLQKEKKGRTVILTTHFMDEADILGDRIAIMAAGRLQCIGSPYFLKQYYGAGYTLVVVKAKGFNVAACTQLLNKYIPNTFVKEDRGSEVTYTLSNEYAHKFEEMLLDLEKSKDIVKFNSYGLIATTLEDVFMAVGSDMHSSDNSSEEDTEPDAKSSTTAVDKCPPRLCNCWKNCMTGKPGRCMFDTPQRYRCGMGPDIPANEKCRFDLALHCFCGREHVAKELPDCTDCKMHESSKQSSNYDKGSTKPGEAGPSGGGGTIVAIVSGTAAADRASLYVSHKKENRDNLDFDNRGGTPNISRGVGTGDTKLKLITGRELLWNHVLAVWLKLYLVWRRSWAMLLMQILAPILLLNTTLAMIAYATRSSDSIEKKPLLLSEGFYKTETLLYHAKSTQGSIGSSSGIAYEKIFKISKVKNMLLTVVKEPLLDYYLKRVRNPLILGHLRNRILIGATFQDHRATAWYSNFGYHDPATSLNYVHAAILRGFCDECNLTVYNHPLRALYTNQDDMELLMKMLSSLLANGIGNSVGIVSAIFVVFYIKERTTRAKLLQKASGLRPEVMWGCAALFDWVWFVIVNIPILLSCALFQVVGLSTFLQLFRVLIVMMVYGICMLPLIYLCSYVFNGPGVGFVSLFFVNVIFGMMAPQIVDVLWSPIYNTQHMGDIIDGVMQFYPLYSLVTAIRSLNHIGLMQHMCLKACVFMKIVMTNLTECNMASMCKHFSSTCCMPALPHWSWESPGVFRYLFSMTISGVILWALLLAAEYRVAQKIFYRERRPPPLIERKLNEDVLKEMRYVEEIGRGLGNLSLVAKKITKYYGNYLAVNQVSFTVKDGECFGLLGVNGAGKTTTFKMLMGDELMSSGDAFVAGHSVKTAINRVYENIGYCPQFDALFNELTGRETMKFFSMLRGLQPDNASTQTLMLAEALGFTKHLDKKTYQYSGGNKRKLSTAIALLGKSRLVFVDEPTTGIDPAARRQVWTALQGARRAGRGVILTSHSMEECEALCSRLTIMVNGGFQCLGTPQHLKTKFSQGFTLIIKLKSDDKTTESAVEERTATIKKFVSINFQGSKIVEEYQGLITYYLPDTGMPWSRMFGLMETAKRDLHVEDYSISQTTLEQIFLQFTKYQNEQGEISKNLEDPDVIQNEEDEIKWKKWSRLVIKIVRKAVFKKKTWRRRLKRVKKFKRRFLRIMLRTPWFPKFPLW